MLQSDTSARLNDPVAQHREPFQIFDNLYYIGIEWVSAYLLTSSEGLVVIDSLYGDFVDNALDGIRKLGFDPTEIRYVLITHAHMDQAGGAKRLQKISGARVGMTQADWQMLERRPADRPQYAVPARDLVLSDGDTIALGDNDIRIFVTPGHTPGVLSMEFTVRDGEEARRAFVFGGVGLNFSGVERTKMYLDSVRRIRSMAGLEVNITNHAGMGQIFERAYRLARRRSGDPHPFVAPADFQDWLEELRINAETKLEEEKRLEASS